MRGKPPSKRQTATNAIQSRTISIYVPGGFRACRAALIAPLDWKHMRLSELPRRTAAVVKSVDDEFTHDPIARRLRDLGFVPGETVQIIAFGPFGQDPLVAQVGDSRFALRRSEAARITVEVVSATVTSIAPAGETEAPPSQRTA